jgi:hypothetical protein
MPCILIGMRDDVKIFCFTLEEQHSGAGRLADMR